MKKPIITDIARYAGVSPATVSRAIHHPELLNQRTLQSIIDTSKKLGYNIKPMHHTSAQNVDVSAKSFDNAVFSCVTDAYHTSERVLLVSCPNTSNPFYEDILAGASASASAHGHHLIVHYESITKSSFPSFCNLLKMLHVSGIILLKLPSEPILRRLSAILPVVQCSEYEKEISIPYTGIDDEAAAKQAVDHLIASGRNRIAFINVPLNYNFSGRRYQGFQTAMHNAMLGIAANWVIQIPDIDYDITYAAVNQLLEGTVYPDAFFAASDVLAAAAINAIRHHGLKVPEDIMVIGFDNTAISRIFRPSITTINQPQYQLGVTACEMLLESINNPGVPVKSMLLDTELIIRESTAGHKLL